MKIWILTLGLLAMSAAVDAKKAAEAPASHPLADMPLRELGPAFSSGRVADFAFHPTRREVFFVGMASGGVWKTENEGITWSPVFNGEGSYSIGVVEIDPHDPNTVWVGSGENNSQRSVGYGDGVYKSMDGGKTWRNMGLRDSGHIGLIQVHPTERNVVYVAALGPLWSAGGDRGLYRSNDGGETWERILAIDEHTGINEFAIDPDNPDVIVAASYQRRRQQWTLINGGPGGGLHKTTDGGKTWRKLEGGLPKGDIGRIGLGPAPSEPDTLYAIIEAEAKSRGVYRSRDFGESWEKRSGYMAASPQYYNELIVDPLDAERVYSMDTFSQISEDGGKTFTPLSFKYRHVDDHALWIDPHATHHLYIGGDGGVFESWDRGQTWRHTTNLPTVQFYRATPDNDLPFYNVCAGTQDNHTQCGPVRTRYTDGITNADWWIAQFGDGFKAQFDPTDPTIVYAQYQYGGLIRMDRRSGERTAITPQPGSGELSPNWNWNTPLIVSPHLHTRLYYGAERLYRSDDRGDNWRAVSGDLTRQIDRNALEVMDRVWSVDAIAKNTSTSIYGSLISIAESPRIEGLLYVGTDDGLIQVSEDGGGNWRRVDRIKGIPERALVSDIAVSLHDDDVAYASFDNHKSGDYKPYVMVTRDRGRSWSPRVSGLPERGTVYTLVEDHVSAGLLFAGTEFGVYFSNDGGEHWQELGALPTIAVWDLEIQRREGDLVIGTFGRGIWILDDYAPLRSTRDTLAVHEATLFGTREAWMFVPDDRRGWGGLGDYGQRFAAANPPHGAVFSYYLRDGYSTLKDTRRKAEDERAKRGEDTPYPSWDALRAEDAEEAPAVVLTVSDASGAVVRRIEGPAAKGFHRVAWDLRWPAPEPINLSPPASLPPWQPPPQGPMALPGEYQLSLAIRQRGQLKALAEPIQFTIKPLFEGGLVAADRAAVFEFQMQTARLYGDISAAIGKLDEIDARIAHVTAAIAQTTASSEADARLVRTLRDDARAPRIALLGDTTVAQRQQRIAMPLANRIGAVVGNWSSSQAITGTDRDSYAIAAREFEPVRAQIRTLDSELSQLESRLDAIDAPWTPGRLPQTEN